MSVELSAEDCIFENRLRGAEFGAGALMSGSMIFWGADLCVWELGGCGVLEEYYFEELFGGNWI